MMNPKLLKAIQKVEAEYGSLGNPLADLTEVHAIVDELHMGGYHRTVQKAHQFWYSKDHGKYLTNSETVAKIYAKMSDHPAHRPVARQFATDEQLVEAMDALQYSDYGLELVPTATV